MSETADSPVFSIQRMYVKDMALEQPHAPQILLESAQPKVDVNLGLSAEGINDGFFEVCVIATVETKVDERTLFRIQAKQAGIFEIRNFPEEQLEAVVGIACPQIIFPYLRSTVSDICTRGGYPPVTLAEVNFHAMFEARKGGPGAGDPTQATQQ
ncbi:protein-export chaperone SecB [Aquabacterium humicola]|uniref:protein-export chaperone SecB n=1 Tax=Aquabacterium humicola TaxID=3237377 RepID=UPI0025436418|nr:protein-export chaperone SecB [Rubrivivax pictus]